MGGSADNRTVLRRRFAYGTTSEYRGHNLPNHFSEGEDVFSGDIDDASGL